MSMVHCSRCGKLISTRAGVCCRCGETLASRAELIESERRRLRRMRMRETLNAAAVLSLASALAVMLYLLI
ncbi:MAG: hypothetical protein IKO47_01835 [Ruminococcus sp.]|nr:hypothetical protein [Ruminococcus sp.]